MKIGLFSIYISQITHFNYNCFYKYYKNTYYPFSPEHKMSSKKRVSTFYKTFLDAVFNNGNNNLEERDIQVDFHVHCFKMIPKMNEEFIFSLTRSYPSPPIYTWLVLGVLGTNISRYCAVARPGCDTGIWERSGAFYNFIAESRLGKGITMNLLWKLGTHINKIRVNNINEADGDIVQKPRSVFLKGGNAIQTHADHAKNCGCGII